MFLASLALVSAAQANSASDARDHWAFKPVSNPKLPDTKDLLWPCGGIDRFILARLEKAELRPAGEADRVTWLRRVFLDLIGLPPSPEQVEAFVNVRGDDAHDRVVAELLNSPRYGERWAQHWLDVVRYADTHGFEVNTERPNAWPYRDYVIEAFNNDTPYDGFIREQIAGDALGEDAATGFLVTASVLLPGQIGKDEPSKRLARQDSLDEIVVNIGQTFLGLSVGCARCHDHKFDPISQSDYYSMQAFIAGVEYGDREWRTPETQALRKEIEPMKTRIGEIDAGLARFQSLARVGSTPLRQTSADSTDRAKNEGGGDKTSLAAFSMEGLNEEEAVEAARLIEEKKGLEARIANATSGLNVFAGAFRTPDVIHRLNRGDPEQPVEEVAPAVLCALGTVTLPKDTAEQERRLALADWIASPGNPLASRVIANRVWQGHFGTGLVDTPSDFGRTGSKPTHPELLDWLAREFIHSGWSIKHLHRLIVLSATYRQSTRFDEIAATKDADARLLWRFPIRRMEAETIRDSMLAVSGHLNLKMDGRGFDLFDKRGGLSGFNPIESFSGEGLRRMIYAHKVRREREAVFGAFDCPDAGQSTAHRRESTTPIQALNLFNSRFTLEQSDAFAARVKKEAGDDSTSQIQRAYRLALGRAPTRAELADTEPAVSQHGLATLCRALFNSNEFLYLP